MFVGIISCPSLLTNSEEQISCFWGIYPIIFLEYPIVFLNKGYQKAKELKNTQLK